MKPISVEKRLKVLRFFFLGEPYDQIVRKTGVSKGFIVNLVSELKDGGIPEFEDLHKEVEMLREVATSLRKTDLRPAEAVLGLLFYRKLTEIGVKPQNVEEWVKLCRKISIPDFPLQKILDAALRLVKLEDKLGIPYEEAILDLQSRLSQLPQLNLTVAELEKKKSVLMEEIKRSQKQVLSLQAELGGLLKGMKHLKELSLEKVNSLAEFIGDFEALSFDVEEVRKLAALRTELLRLKIDPQSLGMFVDLEGKIRFLQMDIKLVDEKKRALFQEFTSLSAVAEVLRSRTIYVTCFVCRTPVPLILPKYSEITAAITRGQMLYSVCQFGHQNWLDPKDVVLSVGWTALNINR